MSAHEQASLRRNPDGSAFPTPEWWKELYGAEIERQTRILSWLPKLPPLTRRQRLLRFLFPGF